MFHEARPEPRPPKTKATEGLRETCCELGYLRLDLDNDMELVARGDLRVRRSSITVSGLGFRSALWLDL